ncbi:MAG: 23S rRNA (guanosine(2251)-2'-O)-methyltransferase RlmB [Kiritimatiellia bacterium]
MHAPLFAPFGDDDDSGSFGFRKPWENNHFDNDRDGFRKPWQQAGDDGDARDSGRKPWKRGNNRFNERKGGASRPAFRKSPRKGFDERLSFGDSRSQSFRKPWENTGDESAARLDSAPFGDNPERHDANSQSWNRPSFSRQKDEHPSRKPFRSAAASGFRGSFRRDDFRNRRDFRNDDADERKPWALERKPWRERAEHPEAPARRSKRTAAIPAEGDLIFGRQPVREVLRAGKRPANLLVLADGVKDSPEVADIRSLCEEKSIRIEFYRREDIEAWTNGANHQGIVLFCADYPYAELDEIVAGLAACNGNGVVVALDHIVDPQNLGSILRTCECAGVIGVVLPTDRAVGVTPAVVRASAGASEHVKIARISNLVVALERFKGAGAWIAGLEAREVSRSYTKVDYTGKVCLVVGSEGHGICSPVRKACDFLVRLPMCGKINSLNAGVAAALALYEILRQQGVEGNGLPACEPFQGADDAAEDAPVADDSGTELPPAAEVDDEGEAAGFDEAAGNVAAETDATPCSELE